MESSKLEGGYNYKGYLISPMIVCFSIRYFIFGEGLSMESCTSYSEAEDKIDKYIVKQYINKKISDISSELNVSSDIVKDSVKEYFL